MLIKYIKSVLWRVAKRLSYIEDARCLKFIPRERAFKQFKSPVLDVLRYQRNLLVSCHIIKLPYKIREDSKNKDSDKEGDEI